MLRDCPNAQVTSTHISLMMHVSYCFTYASFRSIRILFFVPARKVLCFVCVCFSPRLQRAESQRAARDSGALCLWALCLSGWDVSTPLLSRGT